MDIRPNGTVGDHTGRMRREVVFAGTVVWLTAEQGGRDFIPARSDGLGYAATAYVPPTTAVNGLASFVLHHFDPGSPRSAANGRWLTVVNEGHRRIEAGSLVVITEGLRVTAYFHVEHVIEPPASR